MKRIYKERYSNGIFSNVVVNFISNDKVLRQRRLKQKHQTLEVMVHKSKQ